MTKINDIFTIKQATTQDIPIILSFIKELAEHNNSSHSLVATEAILRESLFGEKVYAEVILGCLNQTPVSYALFTHNFSTLLGRPGLYLVDLYVQPEVRGKNVGSHLLKYLALLAKKRNCGRMEGLVLKSNKSAINLYESIGAKGMNEWISYRLTKEDLENLAKETSHFSHEAETNE